MSSFGAELSLTPLTAICKEASRSNDGGSKKIALYTRRRGSWYLSAILLDWGDFMETALSRMLIAAEFYWNAQAIKFFPCIMLDDIPWAQVCVNPANSKCTPDSVFGNRWASVQPSSVLRPPKHEGEDGFGCEIYLRKSYGWKQYRFLD